MQEKAPYVNSQVHMQTAKVICKQQRSYANSKVHMQTAKVICKQQRPYANSKGHMQTANVKNSPDCEELCLFINSAISLQ